MAVGVGELSFGPERGMFMVKISASQKPAPRAANRSLFALPFCCSFVLLDELRHRDAFDGFAHHVERYVVDLFEANATLAHVQAFARL